jgi:GTP-binding protein
LNKLVKVALERHEPPMFMMKRPKIYYATQITSLPPTIILVCNQPQGFSKTYQRYLLTFLRDHLPFGEIPIKLYLQPRARDDERDDLNKEQRNKRDESDAMSAADAGESLDGDIEDFVDEDDEFGDDEFGTGDDADLEYEYNEDDKEEK